jgi:hypothetical protein
MNPMSGLSILHNMVSFFLDSIRTQFGEIEKVIMGVIFRGIIGIMCKNKSYLKILQEWQTITNSHVDKKQKNYSNLPQS